MKRRTVRAGLRKQQREKPSPRRRVRPAKMDELRAVTGLSFLRGGTLCERGGLSIFVMMNDVSIDLIVTDPPWDVGRAAMRRILREATPEMFRVLKLGAHFYCGVPREEKREWETKFAAAGFVLRPSPATLRTSKDWLSGFRPGEGGIARPFNKTVPPHDGEDLRAIIETSSNPGEWVFDPFAGRGDTLAAAFAAGRYYAGAESDPGTLQVCLKRLRELEGADPRAPMREIREVPG